MARSPACGTGGGGSPGPHSSGTWPAPLRCGLPGPPCRRRPPGAAGARGWQPARGYRGGGAAGCPVAAAARRGVFNSGWGFQLPHASHGQYGRPLRRRPCARWSLLSRGACGGGRFTSARRREASSEAADKMDRGPRNATHRRRWRRAPAIPFHRSVSVCTAWLELGRVHDVDGENSAHAIYGETDVALRIHLEDRVYTTRSPIDGFPATTSTSIFLLRSAALRWRWALVTLNFLLRGSLSCRSDADPVCIHISV